MKGVVSGASLTGKHHGSCQLRLRTGVVIVTSSLFWCSWLPQIKSTRFWSRLKNFEKIFYESMVIRPRTTFVSGGSHRQSPKT
ncbi:unnamed protein product [Amoebophrya sp. A120]|nr:unnamed protein product [Amoebophrya sp. A120]|eukprot:GSA120T00007043001.1